MGDRETAPAVRPSPATRNRLAGAPGDLRGVFGRPRRRSLVDARRRRGTPRITAGRDRPEATRRSSPGRGSSRRCSTRWSESSTSEGGTVDLGIAGRDAIVCASTSGLGLACATALAAEGVNVVVNGHTPDHLEPALEAVRTSATGRVTGQLADITTPDGRAALFAACPEPDILVTNNVGPRPGSFFDISDGDFEEAEVVLHYWTPLALVRSVITGMRARRFGRIVNITSAMVAAPGPGMAASAGARTGLTAVMKGLSPVGVVGGRGDGESAPSRTDRHAAPDPGRQGDHGTGRHHLRTGARAPGAGLCIAGRLGRADRVRSCMRALCSVHAGFINGTNLRIDGGKLLRGSSEPDEQAAIWPACRLEGDPPGRADARSPRRARGPARHSFPYRSGS